MTKDSLKETLSEEEKKRVYTQRRKELAQRRAVADARELDELEHERMVQDPRNGLKTKWEIAKLEADKAISAEVTMYNDWRNAMMGLLSMYSALTDALAQSRKEVSHAIIQWLLDPVTPGGTQLPGLRAAYDWATDPEVALPNLYHKVNCNEKNEIEFDKLALETSTGTQLDNRLDLLFRKGVEQWLSECGYKSCGPNSKQFYKTEDNSTLTKDQFNELKNDPNKGLDAFLSDHFDMTIRTSPGFGG